MLDANYGQSISFPSSYKRCFCLEVPVWSDADDVHSPPEVAQEATGIATLAKSVLPVAEKNPRRMRQCTWERKSLQLVRAKKLRPTKKNLLGAGRVRALLIFNEGSSTVPRFFCTSRGAMCAGSAQVTLSKLRRS